MRTISSSQPFIKPRRSLQALGVLEMIIGAFLFLLAPAEVITFSYFSEGGRFHYPGFGIGSFMGLVITGQIVAYYMLGIMGLVMGYGHLRLRSWIRPCMVALLYTWLIFGAPVCLMAFFILAGTKDLSETSGIIAMIGLVLCYSVLPVIMIRFYNSTRVQEALESANPQPGKLVAVPVSLIALTYSGVILIIIFNLLILSNGVFPFFGRWLSGMQGVIALVICIGWTALVTWGNAQRYRWAWWGMLFLVGLFGLSCLITFLQSSYQDILTVMNFPPYEIGFLGGIPAEGYHFAILSGIPLALMWVMTFRSRKQFC